MKTGTGLTRSRVRAVGAATWLIAACAQAGSPWDGLWYLDAAASRTAAHSFSLARLDNGKWQYGDGASATVFAIDGVPYPEPNAPDFTMSARMDGDVLELVEAAYGRDTERDRWTLAADGRTLVVSATRIYPDGVEATSTTTAVRVAGDTGFAGTWKEKPDDAAASSATPAPPSAAPAGSAPSRPYWVISTSSDGVMSWFIPKTGELIRGRPDGRSRPITGPQQPAHRTFVWKQVSAERIDFFASDNGHLVATAIETLSPDGRTFTDTLWSPGHQDEKDVRVFVKH